MSEKQGKIFFISCICVALIILGFIIHDDKKQKNVITNNDVNVETQDKIVSENTQTENDNADDKQADPYDIRYVDPDTPPAKRVVITKKETSEDNNNSNTQNNKKYIDVKKNILLNDTENGLGIDEVNFKTEKHDIEKGTCSDRILFEMRLVNNRNKNYIVSIANLRLNGKTAENDKFSASIEQPTIYANSEGKIKAEITLLKNEIEDYETVTFDVHFNNDSGFSSFLTYSDFEYNIKTGEMKEGTLIENQDSYFDVISRMSTNQFDFNGIGTFEFPATDFLYDWYIANDSTLLKMRTWLFEYNESTFDEFHDDIATINNSATDRHEDYQCLFGISKDKTYIEIIYGDKNNNNFIDINFVTATDFNDEEYLNSLNTFVDSCTFICEDAKAFIRKQIKENIK